MEFEFKEHSSEGTDGSSEELNLNQRFRHAGDLTGEPPTRVVSAHFDLWNVNLS